MTWVPVHEHAWMEEAYIAIQVGIVKLGMATVMEWSQWQILVYCIRIPYHPMQYNIIIVEQVIVVMNMHTHTGCSGAVVENKAAGSGERCTDKREDIQGTTANGSCFFFIGPPRHQNQCPAVCRLTGVYIKINFSCHIICCYFFLDTASSKDLLTNISSCTCLCQSDGFFSLLVTVLMYLAYIDPK